MPRLCPNVVQENYQGLERATVMQHIEENYVRSLIGRVIYHRLAEWKGFRPNNYPYQDKQCADYANVVVDAIGYDDDMILSLEDYLKEKGDDL